MSQVRGPDEDSGSRDRTGGMFLMSSSLDLLMLHLAVELVSLPSYAVAGYKPGDRRASVLGAQSVMIYMLVYLAPFPPRYCYSASGGTRSSRGRRPRSGGRLLH